MFTIKANIIAQLQKDILSLQGYRQTWNNSSINVGLGPINYSFPNDVFPLSAVHEFLCEDPESISSSAAFITGILSSLMKNGRVSLWVSTCRKIFPPALKSFGIEPEKIIFIDLQKKRDVMWVIEEALKCEGLAGVVAELYEFNFNESRRFQLAVEKSNVTGFILRRNPQTFETTACVTRWKIKPLVSELVDDMPGVGYPCWNVELLKVRNGKPGIWNVEWKEGTFQHISKVLLPNQLLLEKTG